MRILHCCFAAFYIDEFGYQENILPREHKRMGYEVEVLASTETYAENLALLDVKPSRYLSADAFSVTRIGYVPWLPRWVAKKLRIYSGIKQHLETFAPDVVFVHGPQFLSIFAVLRHCRRHNVRLYVDSHSDEVNSARGFLSKWVLHRVVYRLCAQAADKVAVRFWATLPLRATFLSRNYGISPQRIDLLPFGADDGRIGAQDRSRVRSEVRRLLGIDDSEFVFVFGGKIDEKKNALQLLRAFAQLKAKKPGLQMRLLVFGKPVASIEAEFRSSVLQDGVVHVDWVESTSVYRLFWAADFAVFPGTHSVLWEEAAGLGVPLAVKRWEGITHLDCGGNCLFLETCDESEMLEVMDRVTSDRKLQASMTEVARNRAARTYSYTAIAARAIDAPLPVPTDGKAHVISRVRS